MSAFHHVKIVKLSCCIGSSKPVMPLCSITISLEVWLHCLFVEWVAWFAWAARGFLSCIDDIAYIALCVKQCKLRKAKDLKVKIYYMLIFNQKQVNPFSNGEKLLKLCPFFCQRKMWNFWAKTKGLVPHTWNFARTQLRSCSKKRLEHSKFVAAALHC